ncbi:MAG TPA: MFS transporter [Xanthobacteraceae bacterium]|nr:MFS transporter [Xanthobacteraceae bacterium]
MSIDSAGTQSWEPPELLTAAKSEHGGMARNKVIDIAQLVDNQPLRLFHIKLVVLAFVVMISDGFDLQAIGYAAPGLVQQWHIDRATLGPIFTASLVGMLIGAPLFGSVGDRFGRRFAILTGVFIYGVFTVASATAETQTQLLALRFLTGIGLGGVPANAVALIAEYAPRRNRATLIVIAQIGLTVGSMLPAVVSGLLEARYGWQSQFIVGGAAPFAIGVILLFALPESLKFMVVAKRPAAQILRVANALDPTLRAADGATFVAPTSGIAGRQRFHIKQLFADGLTWITPLIWALFIIYLMANFFLHSWMPILFRDEGLSIHETAVTTAMFDVGGVLGAIVLSRLIDKRGVAAIAVLFVLACPAVGVIGFIDKSVYLLGTAIFLAGFCLVGITLGMNAVAGLIYPTEIRAKGVGWAYGLGRLGSMSGPLLGAWLIGMHLPISQLFLAPVVPLAAGAVLCFVLMRLCVDRYGGHHLQRRELPDSATYLNKAS